MQQDDQIGNKEGTASESDWINLSEQGTFEEG